ncbi:TetR/AcrR family transcriptional regulator [Gordonia soli]|uniref:Putative TetR family transcriptional regulator n=1 Tax=Gordonia soli NBRC 108243 TaxID=1223545 RepID=M0QEQ6_9ACTN|nr:TetR/AcrR family transcriptional regulator [Gordonia soli]GAC67088.1 putative TetR family transcriptional regulator [Gordonia soli NBRC 108243]
MDEASPGRRERKKAATRRAIAESARRLFLSHGFHDVGIRDIASDSDVAVTTVFAHFACKEALVFENDHEFEFRLNHAVSHRSADVSLVAALKSELEKMLEHCTSSQAAPLWSMIDATEDLRVFEERMRSRHAITLADAIARSEGLPYPTIACRTVARFALDSFDLARRSPEPLKAVADVFTMIDAAWQARP